MGDCPKPPDSTDPESPSERSTDATSDSTPNEMSGPESSDSDFSVSHLSGPSAGPTSSDPSSSHSSSIASESSLGSIDLEEGSSESESSTDSEGSIDFEGSTDSGNATLNPLCKESLRDDAAIDGEDWEAGQLQAPDSTRTIVTSSATRNDPSLTRRPENRPVARSLIKAARARRARIISPGELVDALREAINPCTTNLTIAKRAIDTDMTSSTTESLAAVVEALKGTTNKAIHPPETTSNLITEHASASESDPSLTRSLAAVDETPQTTNLATIVAENSSSVTPSLAAVVGSPPLAGQTHNPSDHTYLTNPAAENDPSSTISLAGVPETPEGARQAPYTSDTDLTNRGVENDSSLTPGFAGEPETPQRASRQATSPSDTDRPAKRLKFDPESDSRGL